ncbi:MAG: hypothetical protein K8T91_17960 [Planctomycetes bacterium]|nr:hypothetical protein [Planctomycetota bacterium]
MIGYVEDYASNKVPILKVALPSGDIEPEPPGLGPITSTEPDFPAKTPAQTPAETPEPPPLTQEESDLLDARAFSHRATGKTYRQIAKKLNIPSSSAYKRVQREMERRREEFAEDEADSRELIVALLDGALEAIATQAYEGDQKAFHLLLQYANTRVRLAKIENPKTPDKMIRKINAAAAVAQETAAQEAMVSQAAAARDAVTAQDGAAAQEVEGGEETKESPLPEGVSGPADTHERCEEDKGVKCAKDVKVRGQVDRTGCGQDCGQRCGQEPQLLAATRVAADEKIVTKPVNTHEENVAKCEVLSREYQGSGGGLGCDRATWDSSMPQPP